ncbi:hypothetical protein D0784_01165 [Vibrio campbellii]|uniref:hypothetical protein n=1 Tax=Vibrio campbellii TaxID=680 RepID=UPI000EFA7A57|nr:hypothetical protein [Vibrio campbellii]AYO08103.1 hypothetical protein D0784_01165 [Vibrio campbellii]
MSKFFICKDVELFESKVINSNCTVKQNYEKINVLNYNFSSFKKKGIDKGNIILFENGDFITSSGTVVFDERVALDALDEIYKKFNGDVSEIKKSCSGIYNILIKKNGKIYLFNDYYGLYDIYYHINDNNEYTIGTKLDDVVNYTGDSSINKFGVITSVFMYCCPDENTEFSNIQKLKSNQYIEFSSNEVSINSISPKEMKIHIKKMSLEEKISYLSSELYKYSNLVSNNFSNINVHCTGGLDSRLVVGALATNNSRMNLLYGNGNSLLAPSNKEDYLISKEIAKYTNNNFVEMNWNSSEVENGLNLAEQKSVFDKVGFLNRIYIGNVNILNEYYERFSSTCDFYEFGYFLESLRLREWAESKNEKLILLDEFIDKYQIPVYINSKTIDFYDEFRAYVKAQFQGFINEQGIEVENGFISIDDFERLRWCTARHADIWMCKLVNDITYSFPIFSAPNIHECILSLSADEIKDGSFQIRLMKEVCPNLLKFPLFSHRRMYKINENFQKEQVFSFKSTADKLIKKLPYVKSFAYALYRRLNYKSHRKLEISVVHDVNELNSKDFSFINTHEFKDDLYPLYYFRQFLIGYNSLLHK